MNRESNTYTILYAAIMVVLVAVALAFTSQVLKKPQEENIKIDKMEQILRSVHQATPDKGAVRDLYKKIVKHELLINTKGEVIATFEGEDIANNEAFNMNTANQFKLLDSSPDLALPLYVAEVDGAKKFILPLNGAGLWNVIWGYIAIDADGSTVFGSDFGHAGETPGLGAEIATETFASRFIGKHIANQAGEVIGIAVVKNGKSPDEREFVDGVTGGTLTSNGVDAMLSHSLKPYEKYLQANATK